MRFIDFVCLVQHERVKIKFRFRFDESDVREDVEELNVIDADGYS